VAGAGCWRRALALTSAIAVLTSISCFAVRKFGMARNTPGSASSMRDRSAASRLVSPCAKAAARPADWQTCLPIVWSQSDNKQAHVARAATS
jgi:hypothetical protein